MPSAAGPRREFPPLFRGAHLHGGGRCSLRFLKRPLLLVIAFTILGSLFIPFLAATLLYLNNRRPLAIRRLRITGAATNAVLLFVLLLFLLAAAWEIPSIF